jgi:predicted transposase YbfD/YdcC
MHRTIIEILHDVPDYRKGNAIRHNLTDILMIGLLTVICNGNDFAAMVLFAETHKELLSQFLELPYGIPSQDTFERVFSKLNPAALAGVFLAWIKETRNTIKDHTTVAIDGKTIRRSKSSHKKAVHIVTAFASSLQLVLGQLATDEKSNEITAIPKLLDMFCKKGIVITIDAMGTQTDIAEKIVSMKAEYVLSLKGNQPALLEDVSLFMDNEIASQNKETLRNSGSYEKTIEKAHGRIETRECFISYDISWLPQKDNWAGFNGIGLIISKREELGKTPTATRNYFIFSMKNALAADLLRIKREHWAIENNLHWMLDVLFREDDARARVEFAAENLNILRKQALQLMKLDSSVPGSMRSKRLRCAYDISFALKVIGVL